MPKLHVFWKYIREEVEVQIFWKCLLYRRAEQISCSYFQTKADNEHILSLPGKHRRFELKCKILGHWIPSQNILWNIGGNARVTQAKLSSANDLLYAQIEFSNTSDLDDDDILYDRDSISEIFVLNISLASINSKELSFDSKSIAILNPEIGISGYIVRFRPVNRRFVPEQMVRWSLSWTENCHEKHGPI